MRWPKCCIGRKAFGVLTEARSEAAALRRVAIVAMLAVLRLPSAMAADPLPDDAIPAADAIRLVLDARGDQIRAFDTAKDRWFDTKERSWSARRPIGPGYIDSTHMFEVTYRIDGVAVATWSVDTAKRAVQPDVLPPR